MNITVKYEQWEDRALLIAMNKKLDTIMSGEGLLLRQGITMTKEIDDLHAAFTATQDAVNQAVTELQALKDELATANSNGDADAIEEVVGKMNTMAKTLSDAAAVPSAVGANSNPPVAPGPPDNTSTDPGVDPSTTGDTDGNTA